MEKAITDVLSAMTKDVTFVSVILALLAGVITSIGPCNMSMVPVIMAYVGGSRQLSRWRSFTLSGSFVVGAAITFVALGVIVAAVGGIFGRTRAALYYIVAMTCLLVGLQMLGVIHVQLPNLSGRIRPSRRKGILGALLLGMAVGLAGSQCGTPVMLVILSVVMAKGKVLFGILLLFAHALGRGVPIVLAGTFTGIIAHSERLARCQNGLSRVGGVGLMVVGLCFLWAA